MLNDKQLDGKLMALMNQKAIAQTTKGVICKVSLNAAFACNLHTKCLKIILHLFKISMLLTKFSSRHDIIMRL